MPVYMTVNDLGRPKPLSFRAIAYSCQLSADVRQLEAYWGNPKGRGRIRRDDWLRAWRNIQASGTESGTSSCVMTRLWFSAAASGAAAPPTIHLMLRGSGSLSSASALKAGTSPPGSPRSVSSMAFEASRSREQAGDGLKARSSSRARLVRAANLRAHGE